MAIKKVNKKEKPSSGRSRKKKSDIPEVTIVSPIIKESAVYTLPEDEIEKPKKQEVLAQVKIQPVVKKGADVPCRVLKNHSCTISKVSYDFKKDQEVYVPSTVAIILSQAGVLLKK